jgi:hypothetical protein
LRSGTAVADLDRRHRLAQQALGERVGQTLAKVIVELPEPLEQEAMERYLARAVPVVAGGQRRAAALGIAYLRELSPPARGKLPPTVDRALSGQLVTADSPVATSPVLRLWGRVNEGDSLGVAQAAAASYAGALAIGDLQVAQRLGLEEGARAAEREVTGWAKELSGDACDWCQEIAGQVYRSADAVPFHDRDRCAVAPAFA